MIHSDILNPKQKDFVACAYLFSPELAKRKGFLDNLKLTSVKKAFREKAKRYHPDSNLTDNTEMISKRQERFTKIIHSYEHLFNKLKKQPSLKKTSTNKSKTGKPHIIAVGGAKGGIGKSILTSNLSVYLSQQGYNTVAVDLDLGGANLHLFLGKPILKHSINDFLANKVNNISEIIEPTKYGPQLIGGNSSQLGAANISFTKKLKLLRAIRKIKTDYVIIDLGGDTSYNVIDFFLAADAGIVMTTCDPASYLDAYSFIKVAIYRKLNRLYGVENRMSDKKDITLQRLINETILPKNNSRPGNIEQLIKRAKKEHPLALQTIQKVLSTFTPQLLVNKVTNDSEAIDPVQRIQKVSRKKLGIDVDYLCAIPYQSQIKKSAKTLVPWVSNKTDSQSRQSIDIIAKTVINTNCKNY